LAGKVSAYFSTRSAAGKAVAGTGLERREHPRRRVSGPLLFQVIASQGRPVSKPFRGGLEDISAGGVAFSINTSNETQAQSLLGRRLKFKFAIPANPAPVESTHTGTVTAVVRQPFAEYSVHVKFDRNLDVAIVTRIAQIPENVRIGHRRGHKAL